MDENPRRSGRSSGPDALPADNIASCLPAWLRLIIDLIGQLAVSISMLQGMMYIEVERHAENKSSFCLYL